MRIVQLHGNLYSLFFKELPFILVYVPSEVCLKEQNQAFLYSFLARIDFYESLCLLVNTYAFKYNNRYEMGLLVLFTQIGKAQKPVLTINHATSAEVRWNVNFDGAWALTVASRPITQAGRIWAAQQNSIWESEDGTARDPLCNFSYSVRF